MRVCFIGHRTIQKKEEIAASLKDTLLELIAKGATTFLFGSRSEFDVISWEAVTALKVKYPFIKRVYVRSAYQYISKSYEKYLLESYEDTYFPPKLENAGKCSYVERNYEMIDSSTYCVFYYNESYVPRLNGQTKSNALLLPECRSGTKIAYSYAKKRNKIIINLYK